MTKIVKRDVTPIDEEKQHVKEYYGEDEEHIVGFAEFDELINPPEPEPYVPQATQLDKIEANTAYLVMMNS